MDNDWITCMDKDWATMEAECLTNWATESPCYQSELEAVALWEGV